MTKFLVLDLETSVNKGPHGSSWRDPQNDFYTIIFGDRPDNIKVQHKASGFKRQLSEECIQLMDESDVIIGHNLPFDLGYIWHVEAFQRFLKRGGKVYDTQVGEYIISGQRHTFASLSELQLIYLNEKVKETRISRLFSKGFGADKIIAAKDTHRRVFRLFDKYSRDDGVTTLKIFLRQVKKAQELNILPVIKLYNAYTLALVNTMCTGIKVDLKRTEKTLQAFKLKSMEYLSESEKLVSSYWSDPLLPPFNVQSPTHKSALLFGGKIKVKVKEDAGFYKNGKPKTKLVEHFVDVKGFNLSLDLTSQSGVAGRYKTGAEIIEKIASVTTDETVLRYCKLQKAAMKLEKMCSTYLEPFLNLSFDGVIYPYYNNTATATSRLSSSKPNLQNVVSKGGMEKYIKGVLIAPEGYTCCSIDFSQLEIFVLALLSGDQSLTNDLLSGIDFHILRLSYAEDMSYDDVYKLCKIDKLPDWELKRSKAKTISYQKAYGASPNSLAKSTGVDVEVIKKIFEKEDITYPGVKEFYDTVTREINNTKTYSLSKHLPSYKKGFNKGGKRFVGGVELLPVTVDAFNTDFYPEELRHIGTYTSMNGKRYTFEEMANYDKFGKIRRGFAPTQIKNYMIQGGAADVVAMATAKVFEYVLQLQHKEVLMCNQIHDSLEFYIKTEEINLHLPKICAILEGVPELFKQYFNLTVPFKFKVDAKIGPNFYDMEEYKHKS